MALSSILDIGDRKQLLVDDRFFCRQYGVKLTVNPPIKAEIVLHGEKPWEAGRCACYASVLEDDGLYKLWYDGMPGGRSEDGLARNLCYATSTDGLHWERENVNLFDWRGQHKNNIVMPGGGASVMLDPKAPEEHRFKALGIASETAVWPESQGVRWDLTGGGIHLWTAPDGVHWKRVRPVASPFFHDSHNILLYDDRLDKYVAYLRTHERGKPFGCRTVGRIELDDPTSTPWPHRPPPEHVKRNEHGLYLCSTHGEYDVTMACDESDPPDSDVQMAPVVKYQWADDVYLSMLTLYRHYPETVEGEFLNDGPQHVQLAVSRDGVEWQRPDRKPYIPLGQVGEWDGGCIWPCLGMIRRGNEIWQYYCGTWHTHGSYDPGTTGVGGLRRLVQRLDGFMSADADYTGGEFTTPLLQFSGTQLELNVDCSATGEVWVEILDEGNRPVDGYTLKEAIPVDRNWIAATVSWSSGAEVGALQGRPVRLHFKLRACKLHAFQFTNERATT